jgi:hypothetical protein
MSAPRRLWLAVAAAILVSAPPVQAQELTQVLDRVASAWQRGDVAAITALAARAGISLDVDGSSVGPLGARQASAVLRRTFENRESVATRLIMSRTVGGDPVRAFGEISWTARARGTTIPEQAKLFIAVVREDGGWRVYEIRLLR